MAKGYKVRVIPEGTAQVNFNLKTVTLEKVKDLAFWEGVSNSEVYTRATEKYIELYEKKHGKLKARPKGKGLDSV
jgi:hypothetical protein